MLAHAKKAEIRMAQPCERIERPEPGLLLKTIRVTDELARESFEIRVTQAKRLNQIVATTFGRSSREHGWDWLARRLREKLVVRWMRA